MKRTFVAVSLLIALGFCFACKDPEGACENPNGKIASCGEGPKTYCEKDRVFFEGKKCAQLGYTRKEGITWFRSLPGMARP